MVLAFLVLNLVFRLLFRYRVSKLIRPFSFWGYIGLILIDGNMQIVFYLMFSQSSLLFSFDFTDKVLNFLANIVFFLFLWFSVACYFLYYHFYKKLAKYFLDNSKCSIDGILSLVLCSTLRQLALSAVHNFLRYDYETQLLALMAVETLHIVAIIFFSTYQRSYHKVYVAWVSVLFSFLRVIFSLTLYFQ